MSHTTRTDHRPDDTVDREAFRAYCTDCSWRGRWRLADPAGESMEARCVAEEDACEHERDTDGLPTGSARYAITVRIARTRDGWESCVDSPTFYLDPNLQGIVGEDHAARIVRHWIAELAPDAEVFVTAVRVP